MPIDYSKYPADWHDISRHIRFERAKGRCEQCGAPHGEFIVRSNSNPYHFIVINRDLDDYAFPTTTPLQITIPGLPSEYTGKLVKVILTVHHIGIAKPDGSPGDPHDKMDCRDENLIALCQRCHLVADAQLHADNARQTRIETKRKLAQAAGQLDLFPLPS